MRIGVGWVFFCWCFRITKIPDNVIDGYLVAEIELMNKRIPFIIRRPISGGGCEYWNLKDLEIIGF